MSAVNREDVIDGWDKYEQETPIAPEQAEAMLRNLSNRIARGVRVCSDRLEEFQKADREYDRAYARAYLGYEGPAHSKKYAAELATVAERDARDVAEASYKYAQDQARGLSSITSAYQSISGSLRTVYGIAGRG